MATYTTQVAAGARVISPPLNVGDVWIPVGNSGPASNGRGSFIDSEYQSGPCGNTLLLTDANGKPYPMVDGSAQQPTPSQNMNTRTWYHGDPSGDVSPHGGGSYAAEDVLVPANTALYCHITVVDDAGNQGPFKLSCQFNTPRPGR